MLQRNLRIFFRSITRQKLDFFLTSSSLILGLTAILLAFVFLNDEKDYDTFHSKSERIFRVNKSVKSLNGDSNKNAETPGLMAPTIDADFPEVEAATHLSPWFNDVLVSYEDQHTYVQNWMFADSNFFEIFDFKMLQGNQPEKILASPGQIIITPKLAQTLFGSKNPIGKTVKGQNNKNFTVAGIVEAPSRKSHIQFDALVSWTSTESQSNLLDFSFMNNWLGQTVYTYLLLRQPEQMAAVNEKLPAFTAQYMENRKNEYDFYLQPLGEIYLQSTDLMYLRGGKYGSASFLRIFSLIALMILLIACFNYINITTVKSLHRAKEVGVKKVLGAEKNQLIKQFMLETITMTGLAALIAVGLSQLLLPQLNVWFVKDIPKSAILSAETLYFLGIIVLVTSLMAGFFPSWLLTKFKPITVLRSHLKLSPHGELPRQILTTIQLAISVGLIAGTLVLHQQFNYILNKDLGFDKEQVLVMDMPEDVAGHVEAFRNSLEAMQGVQSVSICQAAVGDGTFGSTVIPEGFNEQEISIQMFRVDSHYIKTYGLELAEGRFLNRASDIDPGSMVVNEAFVKQTGWTNPLEKTVHFPGSEAKYPIVGVLKDFNFSSLHEKVSPLLMYLDGRTSHISVRVQPEQLATLLPQINTLWTKFESRYPFDYYFVDAFFAEKYASEQQMLRVITLFAVIAIFIACLGLYGLASFAIARRTKEIGIRKVLGASVSSLASLLSVNFIKMVGIALLISTPLVFYFTTEWLQNFAFRIDLSWSVFVMAGLAVLVIVLLTVGLQSIKAALVNPVESLMSE